jgi:ribose transport system substrate-binding protein
MKVKPITLVVAFALASGTMAACGSSSGGSSSAGGAKVPVSFVAGQVGIPFYTSVECGAKDAAKKFNVNLKWGGSTDWDINKEMPLITAAMRLKPKALIFSPTDSTALVPTTQQMKSQGILPITVDAPLDKPVDLANFQSDHNAGGAAAAKAMLQLTGGKGTTLVVGLRPGLLDQDARVKGYVDAMKQSGAKILPVSYPGTDASKSAQQVAAAIRAHPDLTGVYVTHSAAAQGASAAIKQAGKSGKIKLIAFDADPQQVSDLRNGVYDALIAQQPYQMGYQSVELAAKVARNETPKTSVKEENLLGFKVITRKNVDDPALKQYLYRATCS